MEQMTLTPGGWILLVGSMSFVWGLAGWCYYQVMTGRDTSEK